jgi:hypothetical protein
MKSKYLNIIIYAILFLSLLYFVQSCTDMGYQPSGDYISGWVTFSDTNFLAGGYYAISMYKNKSNPFDTLPIKSDSIPMKTTGNGKHAYYRITTVNSGSYYFAVTWIRSALGPNVKPPVVGTLGCDTTINCSSFTLITFPNFSGADFNIFSWTDTTKRVY